MAALSRNTASVAQDFHNAGGRTKTFTNNHSAEENYKQIIAKHTKHLASSKSSPTKSNPLPYSTNATASNIPKWIDYSMASANVSPPATNPNHSDITTTKKRRSTNNKENTENVIPSRTQCNQTIDQVNLKQHFDAYIREQFYNSPKKAPLLNDDAASPKRKLITFETHPELEVSVAGEPTDGTDRMEKRGRKQPQPRKIEQIDEIVSPPSGDAAGNDGANDLNRIRDKHLVRMVSRKKCCFKCKNRNDMMVLSYHTTASLLLHVKWRHGHEKRLCAQSKCERVNRKMQHKCGLQFSKLVH